MYKGHALTLAQLESYRDRGFLLGPLKLSLCGESLGSHLCCPRKTICRLGLPILDGEDLASARRDFDDMLTERTDARAAISTVSRHECKSENAL